MYNYSYNKNLYLLLFIFLFVYCQKEERLVPYSKTFTLTGTLVDDETALPVSNVWLYLYHGKHTCCVGPNPAFAKLDSAQTNAAGQYTIRVSRISDTTTNYAYVFDNIRYFPHNPYLALSSSLPPVYPIIFDWQNQNIGDSLTTDFVKQADYRVLKVDRLQMIFKDVIPPMGDSVFIDVMTNYPRRKPYTETVYTYQDGPITKGLKTVYLLANKETIITTTAVINGVSKVRRDTFTNVQGGTEKILTIDY